MIDPLDRDSPSFDHSFKPSIDLRRAANVLVKQDIEGALNQLRALAIIRVDKLSLEQDYSLDEIDRLSHSRKGEGFKYDKEIVDYVGHAGEEAEEMAEAVSHLNAARDVSKLISVIDSIAKGKILTNEQMEYVAGSTQDRIDEEGARREQISEEVLVYLRNIEKFKESELEKIEYGLEKIDWKKFMQAMNKTVLSNIERQGLAQLIEEQITLTDSIKMPRPVDKQLDKLSNLVTNLDILTDASFDTSDGLVEDYLETLSGHTLNRLDHNDEIASALTRLQEFVALAHGELDMHYHQLEGESVAMR